jgi:hypothetical protein
MIEPVTVPAGLLAEVRLGQTNAERVEIFHGVSVPLASSSLDRPPILIQAGANAPHQPTIGQDPARLPQHAHGLVNVIANPLLGSEKPIGLDLGLDLLVIHCGSSSSAPPTSRSSVRAAI